MLRRSPRKISLPWVLVVPFVMQLLGIVGIVGYLSLRNGQVAVENLANRLMQEVCEHTALKLRNYFSQPLLINQINVDAIESGQIDLQDWPAVEVMLFNRLQEFRDISGVLIGTADGELRAASRRTQLRLLTSDPNRDGLIFDYALTPQGERSQLLQTLARPDVRQMPWYQSATKSQQPVWSPVFQTGDGQDLSLNANLIVHDPVTGEFLGVVSSGIVLSVIDAFLDDFEVSPNGAVFVIERDGLLLGSSTKSPIYERQTTGNQVTLERIHAATSSNPLLRRTAQQIRKSLTTQPPELPSLLPVLTQPETFDFQYQGERLFVEVAPFRDRYGLDLLIVVAVPERDFMAQIQANTRNTIWLCLGATGVAIAMGLLTSRWIAHPISQLSKASQRMAAGHFQQSLRPSPIQEVDVMMNSFNQMCQRIQRHSQSLEAEVRSRTAALEQEICDRKQIETQLEQAKTTAETANRAKSEFLASMSHELRTPLNAILGFTQLMGYKGMANVEYQEYLNIINQSGQHLLTLINNVLDMAKIEANQIDLDFTHVPLNQLLENLEDLFSLKAQGKHLQLNLQIDPNSPPTLYADESKLRQILTNLLSNAIKFTTQGEVTLAVRRHIGSPQEPTLLFEVKDTGQGIAYQDLARIFDPFIQTRDGQKMPGGTGLGLAISKQYAHLLGGDIQVSSQLGQGSCFTLTLPIVDASHGVTPPLTQQQTFELWQRQITPRKLLIAEDQPENRYLLQQCLADTSLDIRYAENGQTCLEIWRHWAPDVILMDLAMPVLDGYETTRQIRLEQSQPSRAHLPIPRIIAITSQAFEDNRCRALAAGCNDFLRKPIKVEELLHKLAQPMTAYRIRPPSKPGLSTTPSAITQSLTAMPKSWLQQLQRLAYHCNDHQIMLLLNELPTDQVLLKHHLATLAESYQFSIIASLVESTLSQSPAATIQSQ